MNTLTMGIVNLKLAEKQNLSEEQIKNIQMCYNVMREVFKIKPLDKQTVSFINRTTTETEFIMQHTWGFPNDSKFHTWWLKNPHCLCPKLDNTERLGTEYKIIVDNCPLHGKGLK